MSRVIDPTCKEALEKLLHSGDSQENTWNLRDSLGHIWVFPYLEVTIKSSAQWFVAT